MYSALSLVGRGEGRRGREEDRVDFPLGREEGRGEGVEVEIRRHIDLVVWERMFLPLTARCLHFVFRIRFSEVKVEPSCRGNYRFCDSYLSPRGG